MAQTPQQAEIKRLNALVSSLRQGLMRRDTRIDALEQQVRGLENLILVPPPTGDPEIDTRNLRMSLLEAQQRVDPPDSLIRLSQKPSE